MSSWGLFNSLARIPGFNVNMSSSRRTASDMHSGFFGIFNVSAFKVSSLGFLLQNNIKICYWWVQCKIPRDFQPEGHSKSISYHGEYSGTHIGEWMLVIMTVVSLGLPPDSQLLSSAASSSTFTQSRLDFAHPSCPLYIETTAIRTHCHPTSQRGRALSDATV